MRITGPGSPRAVVVAVALVLSACTSAPPSDGVLTDEVCRCPDWPDWGDETLNGRLFVFDSDPAAIDNAIYRDRAGTTWCTRGRNGSSFAGVPIGLTFCRPSDPSECANHRECRVGSTPGSVPRDAGPGGTVTIPSDIPCDTVTYLGMAARAEGPVGYGDCCDERVCADQWACAPPTSPTDCPRCRARNGEPCGSDAQCASGVCSEATPTNTHCFCSP